MKKLKVEAEVKNAFSADKESREKGGGEGGHTRFLLFLVI